MNLVEDLGLQEYGTQGRRRRFGTYECPNCLSYFRSAVDHVNSGSTTKCPDCAILIRSNNTIIVQRDTFLSDMYSVHGDTLCFDMDTYVNSHKHVQVTCNNCGHRWGASPTNLKRGHSCPSCSGAWAYHRHNTTTPTIFYVIYLEESDLYKIGITSKSLQIRYASEKVKYSVVYTNKFSSGAEAFHVETLVKRANKLTKYIGPPVLLHGNTEVYTEVHIPNMVMLEILAELKLQELKEINEPTIPAND